MPNLIAETSAWYIVIAIVGGVAASTLLVSTFVTRFAKRQWVKRIGYVEPALQLSAPIQQQTQPRREPVMVLDYVDRELLEDIARQKGIQVDDMTWDVGTIETYREERGADLKADVGVPGAGVGGRISASAARERARSRMKASEMSYNARTLLSELLDALEHDAELRTDLAVVPDGAEGEAFLTGSLMMAYFDWGLDGLPDDDPRKADRKGNRLGG